MSPVCGHFASVLRFLLNFSVGVVPLDNWSELCGLGVFFWDKGYLDLVELKFSVAFSVIRGAFSKRMPRRAHLGMEV